jgi:predicted ferric reductase
VNSVACWWRPSHRSGSTSATSSSTASSTRHPRAYQELDQNFERWLLALDQSPAPAKHPARARARVAGLRKQVDSRAVTLTWLGIFVAAHVFLFLRAFTTYADAGASTAVCIARGCGACLNLDGALILLPVMRSIATIVREWKIARVLPIDTLLDSHKLVGHVIVALSLVHTGAHLSNYAATTSIPQGVFGTTAGLTGATGLSVLLVMWFFALPRIRRSGRFEWFFITHFAFVLWFGLMLAHGPVFWKWTAIPLALYGLEWTIRRRRRVHSSETLEIEALPSRVVRLSVRRPPDFEFEAGAYAYLRIPAIAKYEWHPFTISSNPERRDELEFHVRAVGNWTSALRRWAESPAGPSPLMVDVDGPYGSPSTEVFESRHAVMVAAGIGATPFASVLSSLAARHDAGSTGPETVHFFWVARTPSCFEWFARQLAGQLDEDDEHIDMQIHMTAGGTGLDGVALNLAIELCYAQAQRDVVTGLESRTRLGRPDWRTELEEVVQSCGSDDVDVYFCGPAGLSRDLARECHRRGLRFRAESF